MVGIPGIGYPIGPATTGEASQNKPAAKTTTDPNTEDGLQVSSAGLQASQAARLLSSSPEQEKIRTEQVAQARKRIEDGTYRLQQVVYVVAARMNRYLASNPVTGN